MRWNAAVWAALTDQDSKVFLRPAEVAGSDWRAL